MKGSAFMGCKLLTDAQGGNMKPTLLRNGILVDFPIGRPAQIAANENAAQQIWILGWSAAVWALQTLCLQRVKCGVCPV